MNWQDARYGAHAEMARELFTDTENLGPWYQRLRPGAQEDANDLLPRHVTQSRAPLQSRK